jgi:hypothetical protein
MINQLHKMLSWAYTRTIWGPRCPDYSVDCLVCQHWDTHDWLYDPTYGVDGPVCDTPTRMDLMREAFPDAEVHTVAMPDIAPEELSIPTLPDDIVVAKTMRCVNCGCTADMYADRDDSSMVLLDAIEGWVFTSEVGWVCSDCANMPAER